MEISAGSRIIQNKKKIIMGSGLLNLPRSEKQMHGFPAPNELIRVVIKFPFFMLFDIFAAWHIIFGA